MKVQEYTGKNIVTKNDKENPSVIHITFPPLHSQGQSATKGSFVDKLLAPRKIFPSSLIDTSRREKKLNWHKFYIYTNGLSLLK
jgi:hypothetical protein